MTKNKTELSIIPAKGIGGIKTRNNYKFKEPSVKFKRWVELFFDKSNPNFYGNKTQCALAAYNTSSYNSASCIGYQNYRKLHFSLSVILELEGLGYGELVKIGTSKMLAGSFSDWRELMIMAGYYDPKNKEAPTNTFNFENLNMQFNADRRTREFEEI